MRATRAPSASTRALLQILFFALLAACTVAALQTVGAILVIAMVVTPGATAYLLTDRFRTLLILSVIARRRSRPAVGAYISFFLDGATGGIIVVLQTLLFLLAFVFAPKHGLLAARRRALRRRARCRHERRSGASSPSRSATTSCSGR